MSTLHGSRIDSVRVTDQRISIDLRRESDEPITVGLIERRPFHPSTIDDCTTGDVTLMRQWHSDKILFEVPRYEGGRNRDVSRWLPVEISKDAAGRDKITAMCDPGSVTEISTADQKALEPLVAGGIKGIGDAPSGMRPDHSMFELGLHHATVNIVVSSLVRLDPAPGYLPMEDDGVTYYYNEGYLRGLDQTLTLLRQRNVIASGILLISNRRDAQGQRTSEMAHPDAKINGHFVMPNLVESRGTAMYQAAITLLARRFSQPGKRSPRLDRWIMHNEVDQAGVWTNMGEPTLEEFVAMYLRSTRLVHDVTRRFNPHAKTFISLTNHWAAASPYPQTFIAKDLVQRFTDVARREGDFNWGVAHHPYPKDLRQPRTWNDEVTFDLQTPHITPKNIEVLMAFLEQSAMHFEGKPRSVMLSEQGVNERPEEPNSQQVQAAALVYMYNRIRQFRQIEAFHYHNYQDAPAAEGGLHIGLLDKDGNRKAAWRVYAAMDTDREAVETQFAWPIIGVSGPGELAPRPVQA